MLGDSLRIARQAAGLSLDALAKRTAYSKSYLSHLETGKRVVGAEHVRAYERALGTDLEAFEGTGSLDEAAASFAGSRRTEDGQDAAALLRAGVTHKAAVSGLAESHRGKSRRAAVALLSGIEQYLGWLHLRLQHWQESRQCLDRAAVLAIEADHPMRLATALSYSAFRSSCVGSLGAATDECESARRDSRVHPGMATYLRFQHAELLSKDGMTREARATLAGAESAAEELPVRPGSWYSPAFFAAHTALVLHELADKATPRAAERALSLMPADETGQPLRIRQARRRLYDLVK